LSKIFIIGAGGFGTALAVMTHKNGHDVTLWSVVVSEIDEILKHGQNKKYLPGVEVDPSMNLGGNLSACRGCDIIIIAVASKYVRSVAKLLPDFLSGNEILLSVSKGVEPDTLKRLSEVIKEECPQNPVAALSGPSHAEEVARLVPTTVSVASDDVNVVNKVQTNLTNASFRVYASDDIVGLEIGGALKNVIALCAGVADGLELGDNTKAALMTRGIAEITRLGVAMGGKQKTFSGLSGIGDLIVTCTSMHSRNRRAGIMIGEGISPPLAIERVGTVVEGYGMTKTAYELSKKYNVEMPIAEESYKILFEDKNPKDAILSLMNRAATAENI
jgi:Glycerol-3-phosphate dehydrogenase